MIEGVWGSSPSCCITLVLLVTVVLLTPAAVAALLLNPSIAAGQRWEETPRPPDTHHLLCRLQNPIRPAIISLP
jgi:hypothetical protein